MAKQFTPYNHQFSLFNFEDMRPRLRFSPEDKLYLRMKCNEGKHYLKQGDQFKTLEVLQEIRERLESYERRITNNHKSNGKRTS